MMATVDFFIKTGDLLPEIEAVLADADGVAVNLSSATIVFSMRPVGSTTPTVSRSTATVVDATLGLAKYSWASGNTAVAGDYHAEFEVTWAGKSETFPNDRHLAVRILDGIA